MRSLASVFRYPDERTPPSTRSMQFSSTIKFAISFFSGFVFQACLACSCVSGSLEKSFTNAEVVIEVEPLMRSRDDKSIKHYKIVIDKETRFTSAREVVLRVLTTWKGLANVHVAMRTPTNEGECAYWFEPSETYIVFAYFSKAVQNTTRADRRRNSKQEIPVLHTHLCMDNVTKRDARKFQLIKDKLDRLQRHGVDTRTKSKYTEPLHKRVAEIVKSEIQVFPMSLLDQ